ncbi:MAG: glycosyltransferase family A protein [Dehalococcoidia bacterium]|nr:glycosyltransferase family A protein [Dehalococcoidia bacterium]
MTNISVIITSLNSGTLPKCLGALEKNTDDIYELIIVADEPTKEHWRILRRWADRGASLVVNCARVGSEVATNQGIAVSRGDLIVFLASDCYVTKGWLSPMVAALDKHPEFGWVAAQGEEHGIPVPFSASCSLFTRDLFKKIGMFDEAFTPGYGFSDDDFYHRAMKEGFRPHGIKESWVNHPHPSSTAGPATDHPEGWIRNQKLLFQRHGVVGTHWNEIPVYSVSSGSVDIKFGGAR